MSRLSALSSPASVLRSSAGALFRAGQEVALRFGTTRGQGPVALFLPSAGREGAELLRMWMIASRLDAFGWRAAVVPPRLGLEARRRMVRTLCPDILVMQRARHALNRPHLYPGTRVLYDIDDADGRRCSCWKPLHRTLVSRGWCRRRNRGLDRSASLEQSSSASCRTLLSHRLGTNPSRDLSLRVGLDPTCDHASVGPPPRHMSAAVRSPQGLRPGLRR